ncbi:MAG: T9SS type A sorting domain-containing protein [Ignavibacteriales bacterium]|nr:T9SS type A sorting domain-containing protein [Ignavibacteriales bacterium]
MAKSFVTVTILFLCVFTSYAQVSLNWQNPLPIGSDIVDVQFVSATKGFAISSGSAILTSIDAGMTWSCKDVSTEPGWYFKKLFFLDENQGMIICSVGTQGYLIKTADGGKNWKKYTLPASFLPQALTFRSANLGWIAGDAGKIIKTTDGGLTWQAMSSGITTVIKNIHFTSDNNGIYTSGDIRRTTDGGATWTAVQALTASIYALNFRNATTGYAAGDGGLLYKTTDAGTTWTKLTGASTSGPLYVDIQFVDDNNGFVLRDAATSSASVYRTSDGGTTWQNAMASNPQVGANCFWFFNATTGIVMGRKGALSKTTDAAVNWTSLHSGQRYNIKDICFIDKNYGWVIGHDNSGALTGRTTDGGKNWIFSPTSLFKPYALHFVNKNYGWASCDGGGIYKTTNGGANWFAQTANTQGDHMYDIWFVDTLYGWCIGSNRFMRTTDGGSNWVQTSTPGSYAGGNHIVFFDSLNGIRDISQMNRTTDGGVTWVTSTSYGYGQSKLVYAGGKTVWAIAYNDAKKSMDGGVTWSPKVFYQNFSAYCGAALDSNTCYIAGSKGAIMKTTDGGSTWAYIPSGFNNEFDAMEMRDGELWVGGYYGSLLSTVAMPNGIFDEKSGSVIEGYSLNQNYPNPFNPSTIISYQLQTSGDVKLIVYDMLGNTVATLVNGSQTAGEHTVSFNAAGIASGVYFYRLQTGKLNETRKMLLVR